MKNVSRKRGGTLWYTCSQQGCKETGCADYGSQRERAEMGRRHRNWKCLKHEHSQEVLSVENPTREHVMVVTENANGRYWADGGSTTLSSGLQHGPGFFAWADDFPVGTKLVVTARIKIPPIMKRENGMTEPNLPMTDCCDGTGYADYTAVPCPAPGCPCGNRVNAAG